MADETKEQKVAELKAFFDSAGVVVDIDAIMRDQPVASAGSRTAVDPDAALNAALAKLRAIKGGTYTPQTLAQANLKQRNK